MAEKNRTKLTAFEREMLNTAKKVVEFKTSAEANVVSILYKVPEKLYDSNLTLEDFTENAWKVYFQILYDLILVERKSVVDEITIGLYLTKHDKLRAKYEEYGGFGTIQSAMTYIKEENFDAYVSELRKWKAVIQLCKRGYPVKERLSDYVDMTEEDIYNEHEAYLNHIFANTAFEIDSVNAFDEMHEFIDELNDSVDVGMPLYHADILNAEIGGFNLNGHIYGLGGSSGTGKSSMAFNWVVASAIEQGERVVLIVNEEDARRTRKDLLIWVANNIFKEELHKRTLRDGNFDDDTLKLLRRCADWLDEKKEEHILTVVALERYSVDIAIKVIKKYASAFGCRVFILDTLKESFDAKTDEIYKSMMRDMVKLYDTVKPSAKNVGLFVTYQLGKNSLKTRYLTNNEIGQAKSIVDVMSVNLQMRRPYDDEYEGGSKELTCYKLEGANKKTKIPFKLKKENNPMITFISKSRFGASGVHQIVSECDLSTNVCRDVGICNVPQDF